MRNFFKSLPVIILLAFVITCVSINVFAAQADVEIGDVNSDGNVNAADALKVLKHAAKVTTVDTYIADVSRNGSVEAIDALWILKYAAKIIPDLSYETISATPAPTPTPGPVQENINRLINHIQKNGYTEEGFSYLDIGLSENDTLYAYMSYDAVEDVLGLGITFYEETAEGEAYYNELYMPVTGKNTTVLYFLGYANGDYYEYLEAEAPIEINSVTYESTINYTITDSYNADSSQIPTILKAASSMTNYTFSIWNNILEEELGLGLAELGFSKL